MVEVYSKALDEVIIVERIIHQVESSKPGPTLVFFGGIHGNEPAGIFALKKVLSQISESEIKGSIYAITGNLKALKTGQRFIDEDLNRIWSKSQVSTIGEIGAGNIEQSERQVLYDLVWEIINKKEGPFYFIDLHTTSSQTLPFITINDALINRRFSKLFPVPIVLGIEEYLDGPLLSYINELGYVSLGFEAGQHEEEESISNSIAFIHLVLSFAGAILTEDEEQAKINFKVLETAANKSHTIFEIIHLHQILNGEEFKMKAGFKSFQDIQKGEKIAYSDEQIINSEFNAKIFMPLYQNKGKEGFFIIRPIKTIFLRLSALLRRFNLDGLLVALPGIKWHDKKEGALRVNLRTAKFLAKPIFHLFGYRNKHIDETHLKLYNRERVSKSEMYCKEFWYKNNL
jgi:succinylglutamate desuccinylase